MTNHRITNIEITKRNNTPLGIPDGTVIYHAYVADRDGRDIFGATMGRGRSEMHAINDFIRRAKDSGVDTYGFDFKIVSRIDRT